jgi:hypothetical protein
VSKDTYYSVKRDLLVEGTLILEQFPQNIEFRKKFLRRWHACHATAEIQ